MASTWQWGRAAAVGLALAAVASGMACGGEDAAKPDVMPELRPATVRGTVTAESGGAPLAGIRVVLRAFRDGQAAAEARTGADGTYSVETLPGAFFLEFVNDGAAAYGSELYGATAFPNGVNNRLKAQRLDLAAGATVVADASLLAGRLLQGTVTSSGAAVAGQVVRITDVASGIGTSFTQTTDAAGQYRIWLRPEAYEVRARGQVATVSLASSDQTQDFSAAVGTLTATLHTAAAAAASNVVGYVYDADYLESAALGWEQAATDGTLALFVPAGVTSVVVELRSDSGEPVGSNIYSGGTRRYGGTRVAAPAPGTSAGLGTVTLPAGGILTGRVLKGGVPRWGSRVSVRSGGTAAGDVFLTVRTRGDGSYTLSLPAGTYGRVCTWEGGSSCGTPGTSAYHDDVVITAGATTTLDLSY